MSMSGNLLIKNLLFHNLTGATLAAPPSQKGIPAVPDQDLERLRAMLSHAYEPPSPKNLKTLLRDLKNRLQPKKKQPIVAAEPFPPKRDRKKGAA